MNENEVTFDDYNQIVDDPSKAKTFQLLRILLSLLEVKPKIYWK